MFVMMWVLVLYLNPEQFYEQYRTKDNLEKGIRAFREEWACEHAKQALERGVNLGWVDGSHFGCVYEETFMYPKEYQ